MHQQSFAWNLTDSVFSKMVAAVLRTYQNSTTFFHKSLLTISLFRIISGIWLSLTEWRQIAFFRDTPTIVLEHSGPMPANYKHTHLLTQRHHFCLLEYFVCLYSLGQAIFAHHARFVAYRLTIVASNMCGFTRAPDPPIRSIILNPYYDRDLNIDGKYRDEWNNW